MIKYIFVILITLINLNLKAQSDSLKYYFYNSNYDKTILAGEKLINDKNASYTDYLIIVKAYSYNFEYRKALNTLKIAETAFPSNKEILYSKANILYKYRRIDKSEIAINKLLENDSLNKKYLLLAINIAKLEKNNNVLLKYNKRLLKIDSTNATYNYMTGITYVKLKQNDDAVKYFENAIAYDTSFGDAYKWLARMHDAFKNWDTSLYYINRAINIEPDNISYYKQRANINYDRNHYFRAIIDFEKVWKADTNSSKISFKLGVCYQQIKNYKTANKLFIKSFNIDSTNYRISQYLGMSYYHLKQYNKALYYIEKAQELIQPDTKVTRALQSYLAINYFMNKQYKLAIKYNKIMSDYHPDNLYYYFFIGESFYQLKDYRNANKEYKKITQKLPEEYQTVLENHLREINEQLFFEGNKK